MMDLIEAEQIIDLEYHEEALGRLRDEIKAAFGLDLTDEDLPPGSSYGAVFERVKARLGGLGSPACLTSIAFYRLRGELARMSEREKGQIRPDTLLADLFPWRKRRAVWSRVEKATGLRIPKLVPGPWVNSVHFFAPMLSFLVTPLFAPILCVAGWIAFVQFGAPLHRMVPGRLWAAGDFARAVAGLNHAKLSREAGGTTEKQLRRAFQEIVAEVEDIDPNLVCLDSASALVGT